MYQLPNRRVIYLSTTKLTRHLSTNYQIDGPYTCIYILGFSSFLLQAKQKQKRGH